jgi:hypothetical protein
MAKQEREKMAHKWRRVSESMPWAQVPIGAHIACPGGYAPLISARLVEGGARWAVTTRQGTVITAQDADVWTGVSECAKCGARCEIK